MKTQLTLKEMERGDHNINNNNNKKEMDNANCQVKGTH